MERYAGFADSPPATLMRNAIVSREELRDGVAGFRIQTKEGYPISASGSARAGVPAVPGRESGMDKRHIHLAVDATHEHLSFSRQRLKDTFGNLSVVGKNVVKISFVNPQ